MFHVKHKPYRYNGGSTPPRALAQKGRKETKMEYTIIDITNGTWIARFKHKIEALAFAKNLNASDNRYIVQEYDSTPSKEFENAWRHYTELFKPKENDKPTYMLEAVGFLKALRYFHPEQSELISKEIVNIISDLVLKILGDDK